MTKEKEFAINVAIVLLRALIIWPLWNHFAPMFNAPTFTYWGILGLTYMVRLFVIPNKG